ncbi:FtsK/SpoIIIE domain-containing protein [Rhodococcus qingshengii]|uniref:FtsK/SpoIIIE domain-containing protein n=1 Tax=Rhodococcus qingshengii TaxID=334542 RepID=UPI00287F55E1|nr:FtsK/SpoIIIE domain-containing protein [Rhodococcus qingshengii]
MVPDAVRIPLSNTLTVAAVGMAMTGCGSVLSRAVTDLPAHQLDATSFATFYGALAAGAGASWWGSRKLKHSAAHAVPPALAGPGPLPDQFPPTEMGVAEPGLPTDAFVTRLQQVSEGEPIAVTHPLVQDERGEYTSFRIRATKPGHFATQRVQHTLYTKLSQSVDGFWDYVTDTKADTMTFTRKSGFPEVVTPKVPQRIPQSADEAREMYADFRMRLGVTASEDTLEIDLAKYPHALFIGGTGSGKSVFARAVIESFRAAGWMLFLGDGKGTDYEGLHRQPGIVAISQRTADHMRMVRMVADELRGRQADAQRRKRAGEAQPFQRPPLLLLLDEYATMLANIKGQYGHDEFEADLLFITRVGREFKVHLIISTQEAYRDTLPGQLLGNMSLRVSLGPPEDKTIKEVFPEKLRKDAERIGGTIKKSDRGRGLALMTDDEGDNQAIEFQSFFGYSPGESKPAPNAEIAAAWDKYKSEASDRIRPLYPRLWFAVDGPEYAKDLEELYALPVVVLSGRDGSTRPGMRQYDPLCDEYLGGTSESGTVIYSLDELPDELPTPEIVDDGPAPGTLTKVDSDPDPQLVDDSVRDSAAGSELPAVGIEEVVVAEAVVSPDNGDVDAPPAPVRNPIPRRRQGV